MQKPDEESLGSLIHDVSRLMKRRFTDVASELGLTLPQWRVLAQLIRFGELSQATIAGLIESDPMTVSRMVERMEAVGLVSRIADPQDGRAKLVRASPAAHELFERAKPIAHGIFTEMLDGFTKSEDEALHEGLRRLRANLLASQAGVPCDEVIS